MQPEVTRRFPIGAEVCPTGGVSFRVWAPNSDHVKVQLADHVETFAQAHREVELQPEADGYFSGSIKEAREGMLYKLVLGDQAYPDPASRFQPLGPEGPSQIVRPDSFAWQNRDWKGVSSEGQVIYETHIGTFTREGTWAAACKELPDLARLGVTLIEVMPVADFAGSFGWGYDGVNLFAPTRLYGTPDEFRRFVDCAHGLGLGVILDVVYNHLGPSGNYLGKFSKHYFSHRYECEWGDAINFDDEHAKPVREFYTTNAAYWIDEFHLDGLRLDATQQIFDSSAEHIITAIVGSARAAAGSRNIFIVAENEPQDANILRPAPRGGFGIDAAWNDDFHHTAMVALTGHNEAYYTDYKGSPQEFISALKRGFLYQGQYYSWQEQCRGVPALDIPPHQFVVFLQNHDQVANSLRGQRVHQLACPGRCRALTALLLLGPNTPMLFQGQEFAAPNPFLFFADHEPGLAAQVIAGRHKFLAQFPSLTPVSIVPYIPDPSDSNTFLQCKLDGADRRKHSDSYRLHCDLLRLRREDAVFNLPQPGRIDGAVLAHEVFALRFFGDAGDDRLMIVNLGLEYHVGPMPEPLLAPPKESNWTLLWSSEDPAYGGSGTPELNTEQDWRMPGHAALVFAPHRSTSHV